MSELNFERRRTLFVATLMTKPYDLDEDEAERLADENAADLTAGADPVVLAGRVAAANTFAEERMRERADAANPLVQEYLRRRAERAAAKPNPLAPKPDAPSPLGAPAARPNPVREELLARARAVDRKAGT